MSDKEQILAILDQMLEQAEDKTEIQSMIDGINSGEQDITKFKIQANVKLEKFDGEFDENKQPVETIQYDTEI